MESLSILTILFQLFIGGAVFAPATITNNYVQPTETTVMTEEVSTPAEAMTAVSDTPVKVAKLAQCLTDKGTKMYGAYWCPHCTEQKELFGDYFKLISYQECDDKGVNGNSKLCQQENITGYPTWRIPGADSLEGTQDLEVLAKVANCPY